jgi:hypothetical protein
LDQIINKQGINAAYIRAREYMTIRGTMKNKNIAKKQKN